LIKLNKFYKALLLSPWNPTKASVSLLEQTKCSKFLYSPELAPITKALLAAKEDLRCFQVLSFEEMLLANAEPYPYDYTFEEAARKPILILHSSGSTGILFDG